VGQGKFSKKEVLGDSVSTAREDVVCASCGEKVSEEGFIDLDPFTNFGCNQWEEVEKPILMRGGVWDVCPDGGIGFYCR